MTFARALALVLTLVLAGCGSEPRPPEPTTSPLTRYDDEGKARADVDLMLGKLEVESSQRAALLREFDALIASPKVQSAIKERGLSAVTASITGSGGALVRVGGGSGLVCFAGGRQAVVIDLSGWRAGVTVGGDRTYAVGIVTGLADEALFTGEYDASVQGGEAGEIGTRSGIARPRAGKHVIHFAGTSVGFGADVATGELNIAWAN